MVNGVGFVNYEALALGPGTRLDHSRAFVQQSFVKVKRDRDALPRMSRGCKTGTLEILHRG